VPPLVLDFLANDVTCRCKEESDPASDRIDKNARRRALTEEMKMFNCPSPKGTNNAQLFLTGAGHLVDKHGRNWGRSSMRGLAQDAALASPMSSGPKRPFNPLASSARADLDTALKRLADALGLEHGKMADAIKEIVEQHEGEAAAAHAQSLGAGGSKGAAALDDDPDDDDAFVEERVREFLASKGLDSETIEEALARVKADRAAAKDRLPANAIKNGPPVKQRLEAKDLESEYPGISDYPDTMTLGQLNPNRNAPGYRPEVREASERAMRRAGGGTGIRLKTPAHTPTGDAALASDEALEADYPGISGIKTSVFG
jgi:hypothetical protein